MRALLDLNIVIAPLDPDQSFHERAHAWWAPHAKFGWASCALTENGVIRVRSNPAYSPGTNFTAGDLISRLRLFAEQTDHAFWPDDISLRDEAVFDVQRIHGSSQITDLYLLALSVRQQGRFTTFDKGIPLSAVPAAKVGNPSYSRKSKFCRWKY